MLVYEVEALFKILSKEGTIEDFLEQNPTTTRKEIDDFFEGIVEVIEKKFGTKKEVDI